MPTPALLILVFLLTTGEAFSQTLVSSTGNTVQNASISIDYSLGEISVETLSSTQKQVTQGLLQPLFLVKDCQLMYLIPSAFTPNNDLKNDFFGVKNWPAVSFFELSIYNRLGQLVFKTRKLTEAWNGELNGKPQPPGVYVYLVKATTPVCGSFAKKGTVVLIR